MALRRAIWNVLTRGCFTFFLVLNSVSFEVFLYLHVHPCCLLWSYLCGFWIHGRFVVYAASLLWTLWLMPHVVWMPRVLTEKLLSFRVWLLYHGQMVCLETQMCLYQVPLSLCQQCEQDNSFGQCHRRRNFFF